MAPINKNTKSEKKKKKKCEIALNRKCTQWPNDKKASLTWSVLQ